MTYLKLKKIEVDSAVKKLVEPLVFDVQLTCTNEIKEGVEFVVLYNVDVHSDNDDQVLSEIEIAPIPKGKVGFRIEADAPKIDLIPADQLFGLTSIIIVGKYMEQQFIRIGYIVDVSYPGIPTDKLVRNDVGEPSEEISDEEEIGSELEEDDYEDSGYEDDDESLEDGEQPEDGEECLCSGECKCGRNRTKTFVEAVEEGIAEGRERKFGDEGKEEEMEEKVFEDSYSEVERELDKTVGESVSVEREDDILECCGYRLDKKQIEMKLMEPPVISLFEINWGEGPEACELSTPHEDLPGKRLKTEE